MQRAVGFIFQLHQAERPASGLHGTRGAPGPEDGRGGLLPEDPQESHQGIQIVSATRVLRRAGYSVCVLQVEPVFSTCAYKQLFAYAA